MTARSLRVVGAVVLLFGGTLLAAQNREFGRTQAPRDSRAQATDGETEVTATISGRVVAADTGEPLKRARVTARVSGARGRVASTTDAAGRYALVGLRAGRYTISVSRPGFVTLSYGQRRPRQPATPIQVLAGDDVHDVSFSLPRGSVITGRLVDEDGVALPLAAVRAMRYVYRQGHRQLVPVGEDRSDDRGQYRIFGLAPGDYYVSATAPGQLGRSTVGRFNPGAGGPAERFAPGVGRPAERFAPGVGRPADRFAPGVGRPADRFAPGVGRPADRFAPGVGRPADRFAPGVGRPADRFAPGVGRPADRFAPGVGRPADRFAPGVGRPADRFAPGVGRPADRFAPGVGRPADRFAPGVGRPADRFAPGVGRPADRFAPGVGRPADRFAPGVGRPADRFAPGVGRPADRFAPGVGRPADRFAPGAAGPARRVADPFEPPRADADQGLGYAPTYYPGATGLAQALPVTLGLSSEVTGVDFGVLLVPTARVSGTVLRADGVHPGAARVMLVPEDRAFFRGATSGARVEDDGRFEIRHVAPGRYILRAVLRRTFSRQRDGGRPRGRTPPMFASQALEIDGFDVTDLTLVLGPGARLSGSVDFDTAGGDPDDVTRIRVSATPLVPNPMIGGADARVQSDGTFELEGIADGARLLRTSGAPTGWVLQAVYLDGRDVIDTPLDFGGASHLEGVRLVFSDRVSELSGVVHDRRGEPLTDFTVIAFPPNEERWQPASRFIRASRPDQNGSYRITGLPAGDYLLAAVDVVEQGEWYDPRFLDPLRAGAVRLRLGAGEAKALNLTLSAQQ